jgi:hypothetical protein
MGRFLGDGGRLVWPTIVVAIAVVVSGLLPLGIGGGRLPTPYLASARQRSSVPHATEPSSPRAQTSIALVAQTKYGIELTWPQSAASCFSHYGLSWYDPTAGDWYGPLTFSGRANTTFLATTDFEPGVAYSYKLEYDNCGNVTVGVAFANFTQPNTYWIICQPLNQTSVTCTWSDADIYGGYIGFYEYRVGYVRDTCGPDCGIFTYVANVTNVGNTTFTATALVPGTTYQFEVSITDQCTSSPPQSNLIGGCDTYQPGPPFGSIFDGYSTTNVTTSPSPRATAGPLAAVESPMVLLGIGAAVVAVGLIIFFVSRRSHRTYGADQKELGQSLGPTEPSRQSPIHPDSPRRRRFVRSSKPGDGRVN